MFTSYKFRIYPNERQREKLAKTFGCARFVWNSFVAAFNKQEKPKKISELRVENLFLKQISACALGQAFRNFEATKKQYFSKTRKTKLGRPKFKKKGVSRDSFSLDARFKIVGKRVRIEKVGDIKIVQDREIQGRPVGITISKNRANQYFAAIKVEVPGFQQKEKTNKSIGLDLGLTKFLTLSDGTTVDNPRYFAKNQSKIARLQRFQSKKVNGSVRYNKLKLRLARLHLKVANRRQHFLHEISSKLINQYDFIGLEDLNVRGMVKNRRLAKSISDVSWSEFVRQLEYKAERHGKIVVKINRFEPSSKACSGCGSIKAGLALNERTYVCNNCNLSLDRDHNAAINIKNKALEKYNAIRTLSTGSMGSNESKHGTLKRLNTESSRV